MTDDELDQRVRASVLGEQIDTSRVELAVRNRIGQRHVPGWAVAAAAVIAMVAASVLSYRTFIKESSVKEQTPPICVAAAQDHQREIEQGAPRTWLSDISAIQSLAERQGVPASDITALETTGYHFERGRLCFLKKQIFLHLVYTKDGAEYSVYLRPPSGLFNNSVRGEGTLAYFETKRVTAVFVSHGADALAFARASARVL
jgi:hypothetical protein